MEYNAVYETDGLLKELEYKSEDLGRIEVELNRELSGRKELSYSIYRINEDDYGSNVPVMFNRRVFEDRFKLEDPVEAEVEEEMEIIEEVQDLVRNKLGYDSGDITDNEFEFVYIEEELENPLLTD